MALLQSEIQAQKIRYRRNCVPSPLKKWIYAVHPHSIEVTAETKDDIIEIMSLCDKVGKYQGYYTLASTIYITYKLPYGPVEIAYICTSENDMRNVVTKILMQDCEVTSTTNYYESWSVRCNT